MKRRLAVLLAGCLVFSLAACSSSGNSEHPSQMQEAIQEQEQNPIQITTSPERNETEQVEKEQEQTEMPVSDEFLDVDVYSFADGAPEEQSEMKADELLDLFISGSIKAVDPANPTSAFYITDLNMDPEEWDSYSIGEKIDLDNDGENELILNGPYGGMYLDARNNQVCMFAAGEGNALTLSYTYYDGTVWIMYSNTVSTGYEYYHIERFEGADNLVAEMDFSEEPVESDNPESGTKYTLNGTEISYEEYCELSNIIFTAQVTTN